MDPLSSNCGFCKKSIQLISSIRGINDPSSLQYFWKELNNFRETTSFGQGKTLKVSINQLSDELDSDLGCLVCLDCNKLWEEWIQINTILEDIKKQQKLLLERIDKVIPNEGIDNPEGLICEDGIKEEEEEEKEFILFPFEVDQESESEDGSESCEEDKDFNPESEDCSKDEEEDNELYLPEKYSVNVKPTIDLNKEFKEELECPEEPGLLNSTQEIESASNCEDSSSFKKKKSNKRKHSKSPTKGSSNKTVRVNGLKCEYCPDKIFKKHSIEQREMLIAHLQNDHPNLRKKYSCKVLSCEEKFIAQILLNEHKRQVHSFKSLKEPVKKPSKSKIFPCSICGKIFRVAFKRKIHETYHDKKLVCEICQPEVCYSQPIPFCEHLYKFHEKDATPEQKTLVCSKPDCSASFMTPYMYDRHLQYHSQDDTKPLGCPICFVRFASNDQVGLEHHKKYHFKEKNRRKTETEIHCKVQSCDKVFPKTYGLYNHERIHHPELLIYCCTHTGDPDTSTKCDKKYSEESFLTTHLLTHSTEGPFKCGIGKCSAMFLTGKLLSYHLEKHAGKIKKSVSKTLCKYCGQGFIAHKIIARCDENNYACCQCQAKYIENMELIDHLKQAHSELPIKDMSVPCELCGKNVLNKYYLRNHIKLVHKRSQLSMCDLCGKQLTSKSSLRDHMKIHKEIKNHKCEHCGKSFVRRDALRSHIYTHTGEKPFKCYICPMRFNQLSWMKRHVETHRKDGSWFPKPDSAASKLPSNVKTTAGTEVQSATASAASNQHADSNDSSLDFGFDT